MTKVMAQAPILLALAAAAFAQPDLAQLRSLFDQNLSRAQRDYGATDARTAQAARDRAMFLERAGDKAGTRTAYRETLRLDDQSIGPNAAQTLEDAAALAALLPALTAAPLYARASNSPDPTVAGPALSSLAAIRKSAGDRVGAAALLRRALAQAEAVEGKDGGIVALVLTALADVAPAEEAVAALRRALEIDRRVSGPRGQATLRAAHDLAAVLRRSGRAADAAAVEREFGIPPPGPSR
jgi:hypothetical protein